MPGLLTIGQLAALASVSPDTIRYYERLALLPKPLRSLAGYRQYPHAVAHRLDLIRNAQRFGFSLAEIAGFLTVRESGGKPCGEVRAAAQRMLHAVDRQITELKATRARMTVTLREWDKKLSATPGDRPAHLLEALTASDHAARPKRFARRA